MTADDSPRRPPLAPLKRAFTLRFHTPAQLDRIKQATLDILGTVGVRVPSARALDILAGHGCTVDRERQVVRFPPELVLSAMVKAPRYFDLGARDPSCAFSICDDTTWCTSDGCGVEIVDFDSGLPRAWSTARARRASPSRWPP
jgi:trimethylamine--corrinoid protein Co-methyltransferase